MKSLVLGLLMLSTFTSVAFSQTSNFNSASYTEIGKSQESILHEMLLGCVSTKKECTALAKQQGYSTSKTSRDRARCPAAPKLLACIVKH